jgi:hypothetical protein
LNIQDLASFGDIAAEDDSALLDYFLSTYAAQNIRDGRVIIVLGRKGSGKTALVRHFAEGPANRGNVALNLRDYPWAAHARLVDSGASPVEAYTASWRLLIAVSLASMAVDLAGVRHTDTLRDLRAFLSQNYGGASPQLSDIIRPKKLRVAAATIAPSVLGNQLGSLSLDREDGGAQFGLEANAVADALLHAAMVALREVEVPRVYLHFDELDHGLDSIDVDRGRLLIGLVLAIREVARRYREDSFQACPVMYLRSDIWDQLTFSDKNKVSQTSALELKWSSDELQRMVNVRLERKFGSGMAWDDFDDHQKMRGSQTKWNHMLARTFLRPRDVIRFLNSALEQSRRNSNSECPGKFSNRNITDSREDYSSYLKSELDDEIIPHWPHWAEALQACSSIETITFKREQFEEAYGKRRSSENEVGAGSALSLLYRFSVIGCEKRSGYGGSSWSYQYENPDIGFDPSAPRFKVHIGLKEYARLKEEREG